MNMNTHAAASSPREGTRSRDPLDFEYSPAISSRIRHELVEGLSRGGGRQKQEAVIAALGDRDFLSEFSQTFEPLGLRRNNLADAVTAYWICMWTLIHQSELPSPSVFSAARRQLAAMWSKSPQARREADRQAMAEVMIHETVLALEERAQAQSSGDEQKLQTLAGNAARNMQQNRGVNLKAMQLTESGFQRKARDG